MAEVLRGLVAISFAGRADSGSVKQGEAQRVVAGLVGAGFRSGKNCDAKGAGLIGEIEPTMRSHLERFWIVRGPLDGSRAPVVSGVKIRGSERKNGFQRGFARFPVDGVGELDAIAGVAGGEADGLDEF